MPLYIGWCFLDLKWTFYRALLPIYIKNDTLLVANHARMDTITDSGQVYVLQLHFCIDPDSTCSWTAQLWMWHEHVAEFVLFRSSLAEELIKTGLLVLSLIHISEPTRPY